MSPREERNGDTGRGGERRNSGSFTVFETISFNVVIPITNVLCYFWRRFFRQNQKQHISIFRATNTFPFFLRFPFRCFLCFVAGSVAFSWTWCCLFSEASNKNMENNVISWEIKIQIKFSIVCKFFSFYLNFIWFHFIPFFLYP